MFEKIKDVMSAEQVRAELPMSKQMRDKKELAVGSVRDILSGKDKRKLFIVGPCSADNEDAVCDYARRKKTENHGK